MKGVNEWLSANKHRISRWLLWFLLGGIVMAVIGMYVERRVDWQGAGVHKAVDALVRMGENDSAFSAQTDNGKKVFFCTEGHPFCRVLFDYERRYDAQRTSNSGFRADLEYLSVDEGNILLSAAYDDAQNGERVVLRLPRETVDEQVAMVERHVARWHVLPIYLRQVCFTVFLLLVLVRIYIVFADKLSAGVKAGGRRL